MQLSSLAEALWALSFASHAAYHNARQIDMQYVYLWKESASQMPASNWAQAWPVNFEDKLQTIPVV